MSTVLVIPESGNSAPASESESTPALTPETVEAIAETVAETVAEEIQEENQETQVLTQLLSRVESLSERVETMIQQTGANQERLESLTEMLLEETQEEPEITVEEINIPIVEETPEPKPNFLQRLLL